MIQAPFCEMIWDNVRSIGVGFAKNERMSCVVVVYDREKTEKEDISLRVKPRIKVYKPLSDDIDF